MPSLSSVVVDSWASNLIAALVPGADAVLPFLPGETVMIAIEATAG